MKNTRSLTLLGILLAVEIILCFTPLGFIPLGIINATTSHIPVIIGAIFLGPIGGMILGGAFGIMSMINATTSPGLTSFVFSPFVSIGGISGNFYSVITAMVPRILIGLVVAVAYSIMDKLKVKATLKYTLCGLIGSLTNTVLVLSCIYIFFGQEYATAIGSDFSLLFGFIMGIVMTNGVPEAIVAAVIVTMLCTILKKVFRQDFKLSLKRG
ncbi:MAG: ECF transporter S component [Epulopiscium sp. Nele67-Bin004]|nr:MAG: ECF transporter S component [Epulopiscium sp. Nele67-Bin004]